MKCLKLLREVWWLECETRSWEQARNQTSAPLGTSVTQEDTLDHPHGAWLGDPALNPQSAMSSC